MASTSVKSNIAVAIPVFASALVSFIFEFKNVKKKDSNSWPTSSSTSVYFLCMPLSPSPIVNGTFSVAYIVCNACFFIANRREVFSLKTKVNPATCLTNLPEYLSDLPSRFKANPLICWPGLIGVGVESHVLKSISFEYTLPL